MLLTEEVSQKIIAEINIRLNNIYPNHVNQLKKLMEKYNIFISALFIVECICQEFFPEPTIDFFVDKESLKPLQKFMEETTYKNSSMKSSPHILGNHRTSVHTFCLQNNYEIRVYCVKNLTQPIHQWLDNVIDFDICKNYYKIEDSVEQIYVKSYEQTINKSTNFQFAKIVDGINNKYTIEKYIEYKKLGITFLNAGNEMYNYIIDNAILVNKAGIPKKMYFNFEICRTGRKSYIDAKGKKSYWYIFDLTSGHIHDLENNIFSTYGSNENKQIINHNNIRIVNGKIFIDRENVKKLCNKEKDLCKNYCPNAVCGIDKPHFHCIGTNIRCCCIRTYLTFFVIDKN